MTACTIRATSARAKSFAADWSRARPSKLTATDSLSSYIPNRDGDGRRAHLRLRGIGADAYWANHGSRLIIDMDVFDADKLRAAVPEPSQRFDLSGERL